MREYASALCHAASRGALALRFRAGIYRLVGLLDQCAHPGAAPLVLSADGRPPARIARAACAGLVRRNRAWRAALQSRCAVRLFMAIFVTGSTGYLGSYLAAGLFNEHRDKLNLLIRAKTEQEAHERLWTSLQLHLEFPEFSEYLNTRVRIFRGDLTAGRFGLSDDEYHALVDTTDSLIHCAASLNRKSEKQCLNVNLRGTLEVIQLARRAQNRNGLRRYSHVSTVAVAVKRNQKEAPVHGIYHLWSGMGSQTYHELTDALAQAGGMLRPMFLPSLGGPFSSTVNWIANRSGATGYGASLLKVFWPYLDWNTVFDNSRVVAELGETPAKFSTYAAPLLKYSRDNKFQFPAKPWPSSPGAEKNATAGRARA